MTTLWTNLKNRANSQTSSVFWIHFIFSEFHFEIITFLWLTLDFSLFWSSHLTIITNKSLTNTTKNLYWYFVKFIKNTHLHWIFEIGTISMLNWLYWLKCHFSQYLTYPGARKKLLSWHYIGLQNDLLYNTVFQRL